MAHGGPDWGTEGPLSTVYSIQDMGELAARLGSVVIFDRRGNVISIDYFESGIEQWYSTGDMGYSVDWNGNYAKTGGFSCKLTTGPVAGYTAEIQKHLAIPVLSSLGMEVSFSYKQNWRYLDFKLYVADGSYTYEAQIRFDAVNEKLQYLDNEGNHQDVPGGAHIPLSQPYEFDTLKFVADFTTAKYKRLIASNQEFDLSAISFAKEPLALSPLMIAYITLTTDIDEAAIGYIDDAIFTQNEP